MNDVVIHCENLGKTYQEGDLRPVYNHLRGVFADLYAGQQQISLLSFGSRAGDFTAALEWKFYFTTRHDYYGPLPFPPLGALGVVLALLGAWRNVADLWAFAVCFWVFLVICNSGRMDGFHSIFVAPIELDTKKFNIKENRQGFITCPHNLVFMTLPLFIRHNSDSTI